MTECDLQLALGEAERQSGVPSFRQTYLDAARLAEQAGSTDRLVAAALGNSRGFFSSIGVIDVERVAVLESALSALPEEDGNERALLLATLCSELTLGTTLAQRKALADAARSMARRLGDPTTIVRTLNLVCDPLQVPPTLSERLVDAREASDLADALDDPDLRFWTGAYARMAATQAGDFDWSRRCLDSMRSVIDGLRQPGMLWVTLFNEAAEAILTGNPDQAEGFANAALAVGFRKRSTGRRELLRSRDDRDPQPAGPAGRARADDRADSRGQSGPRGLPGHAGGRTPPGRKPGGGTPPTRGGDGRSRSCAV